MQWPEKLRDKRLVLACWATKFEFERLCLERKVHEIVKQWLTSSDWPLLRSELFE